MQGDRIRVGDTVNIFWENIEAEFYYLVLYIPLTTGDNWILENLDSKKIIYVDSFAKMEKV